MPSFVDPSVYDDVEAVAAAEILVEMARSSRSAHSPPSQYSSSSSTFSTFSSKAPTPFSSSAPTATISLEAVSSRPSNTGPGLVVEVEPIYEYDAYSDLGLTVSSLSPTWSTFELSTPTLLSSIPNEILVVPATKKLDKGSPAYELR